MMYVYDTDLQLASLSRVTCVSGSGGHAVNLLFIRYYFGSYLRYTDSWHTAGCLARARIQCVCLLGLFSTRDWAKKKKKKISH